MSDANAIKTDEKKQHFDDIYVAENPVPFKERILDALDYISDNHNRATFNRLIRPWVDTQGDRKVPYVDLCCCFGNTTLAIGHEMSTDDIRENWKDAPTSDQALKPRALPLTTTGIDISAPALAYGQRAGIFDQTIQANLNEPTPEAAAAAHTALSEADLLISTASLVYLDLEAIERWIGAFASAPRPGYAMVNFLNPFSLEKADATKQLLLRHLDFVGGGATRHRRMSPLEQSNYPGEDWALLEIWVLKRRVG